MATQVAVPYDEEADGILAEAVLAATKLPVLLVRAWLPEGRAALLADAPRILVPLDGSTANEAALPVAAGLAMVLGGSLVLVRAAARPDLALAPDALAAPLLREELVEERAIAERYMRELVPRAATGGRLVETVVRVGRPGLDMAASVIEAVGRECGAAAVVMTSHRREGVERLLLGSVADATLRPSTLPVIVLRH